MRLGLVVALLWASALSAQEFTTLKGHGGPIMGLAMSDEGQVASASFDNSLGMWRDGVPVWRDGHGAAVTAISYAGSQGLISGADDFRVLYWPMTLANPQEILQHKGKISDVAFDPASQSIASASWDGTLKVLRAVRFDAGEVHSEPPMVLRGHQSGVNAVAFADRALLSCSSDGTIRRWDLETGSSRVVVKHGFGINRLVVDAQAGWMAYGAVDGGTRIIDLEHETEIKDVTLDRRPILSMAYHEPTAQLAVGDGQGYIMLLDTQTWSITRDFRATRRGPIWALAFSVDGQHLWAGGLDDVIYGWPVELLDQFDPVDGPKRSFQRAAAEMSNGERQFMRKCSICHALDRQGKRKAGPTLAGVFGRPAGGLAGYPYSESLRETGIIWTDETINDLFDQGPDHYIPGSKMPMQVIAQQTDRDDLIAFLKQSTKE